MRKKQVYHFINVWNVIWNKTENKTNKTLEGDERKERKKTPFHSFGMLSIFFLCFIPFYLTEVWNQICSPIASIFDCFHLRLHFRVHNSFHFPPLLTSRLALDIYLNPESKTSESITLCWCWAMPKLSIHMISIFSLHLFLFSILKCFTNVRRKKIFF